MIIKNYEIMKQTKSSSFVILRLFVNPCRKIVVLFELTYYSDFFLDFLVENGFVHKIERLNAFVACAHPGQTHSPAFMICRICDAVAEAQSLPAKGALGAAARAAGFQIERTVVEAEGVCPACADKANP